MTGYSQSGSSDSRRLFWTILEMEAPQGWIVSMSLVQYASTAVEAASRSAGWQMPRDWRPRRIQVHEQAPHVFEWVQVEPYLCAVGKELSAP